MIFHFNFRFELSNLYPNDCIFKLPDKLLTTNLNAHKRYLNPHPVTQNTKPDNLVF